LPWIIVISLYSGQRIGAILNLHWDRIDLKNKLINWQYKKTTKKRRIKQPMPDEVALFLTYLKKYGSGYLFERAGKPMEDIGQGLDKALKIVNIKNVTPHTLKHTAIT
jgi:integrase